MAYKTCPDYGERVYNLGCTWCNEIAYIQEQDRLTDLHYPERRSDEATGPANPQELNDQGREEEK
jgi:hypothetical protein